MANNSPSDGFKAMTDEQLLDAFTVGQMPEVREEILRRMKENRNGYDNEGQANEDLTFTDLMFAVVKYGTEEEQSHNVNVEIEGELLHEHGMESQMAIYFDANDLLAGLEIGDTVIVRGLIEELEGNFTLEVEKTSEDNLSYGISMCGEGFYYDLA